MSFPAPDELFELIVCPSSVYPELSKLTSTPEDVLSKDNVFTPFPPSK